MAFTVKECRRCGGRERYANGKCATCARARGRERRESGRHSEYQAEWREKNPDKAREYHFKNRYGITLARYQEMVAAQGGLCLVCQKPETAISRWGTQRELSVDHCHATGVVRGLLCHSCNRVLGLLKDDPDLLRRGADYLEGRL